MATRRHKNKKSHIRKSNKKLMSPQLKRTPATWQNNIGPPEMDVKLTWETSAELGTSTADESVRFKINSLYDIDPLLSSTAIPGFAEWSSQYNFYRVVKVGYSVFFINRDLLRTAMCLTYLSNSDPGVTMPRSNIGNALCKYTCISTAQGMNRGRLSSTCNVSTILGSNTVETDPNYRALTNADPADLVWLGVGVSTTPTGPSTSPVTCFIVITMYARFYDRKASIPALLTTSLQDKQKIKDLEKKLAALQLSLTQ